MKHVLPLLLAFFGTEIFANTVYAPPVAGTASTVSTKILNQRASRGYLIIVNTGSTNTIYASTATQSGTQGVPIPAGGSYEPIVAPSNTIYLKTSASTSTYVVVEGSN